MIDPIAGPITGEPGAASAWMASLTRKIGIMASGTLSSLVLGFGLSVVCARLLGPETLASYATVSISALLLAQLADLGLPNAFAYYARHRPNAIPALLKILGQHLVFSAAVTVVGIVLVTVFGGATLHEALSPGWFQSVLVGFVVASTAVTILPVLILARARYRAYVLFTTLNSALHLAAVLAVAAVTGPSWRGFVTALAGANGALALAELGYVRRFELGHTDASVTARDCYSYGLRIKWGEVMKLLSGRIDLFVVAALLPSRQVGVYSILMSFRELGMMPLRTYSGILQNLLVSRARSGADDRELVIGSLLLQAAVSVLLSVGAAIGLPILIPLIYGRAFDAGGPAAVLFASTTFLSVAGLCWAMFNMWGRPELTSRIVTIAGLVGPLILWIFTSRTGLYGAALGSVASSLLVCVVSLVALTRLRGYTSRDLVSVGRLVSQVLRDFRIAAYTNVRDAVASSSLNRF